MTNIIIIILMIANVFTTIFFWRRFVERRSIIGMVFCAVWAMHYVIGCSFALLSSDMAFNLLRFDDFSEYYIISMLVGQYFIWVYGLLLLRVPPFDGHNVMYSQKAFVPVSAFYGAAVLGALLFAFVIGFGTYFSAAMAENRSNLSIIAGEGIGIYYYIGAFLVPATLLIGAYILNHPTKRNLFIAFGVTVLALILLLPLGGRGRIINITFALLLTYFIINNEYRISKFISFKWIAAFVSIIGLAYIWGVVRETSDLTLAAENTELPMIFRGLAVDLTRLQSQSFIFDRYPISGTYWGTHYIESILGPFAKFSPFQPVDLIKELSQSWYFDTIGAFGINSAISPSYLGEIYINFGVLGIVIAPVAFYGLIYGGYVLFGRSHPLSLAVIAYFVQYNMFNGGLYAMFDLLLLCMPILLMNRYVLPRVRLVPLRRELPPNPAAFRDIAARLPR
jgi:oligosaccharide repeat unit polymerase